MAGLGVEGWGGQDRRALRGAQDSGQSHSIAAVRTMVTMCLNPTPTPTAARPPVSWLQEGEGGSPEDTFHSSQPSGHQTRQRRAERTSGWVTTSPVIKTWLPLGTCENSDNEAFYLHQTSLGMKA